MYDAQLISLFVGAFLSSTLLPGGSEALLLYLATQSEHPAWVLLIVASIGNTLGGMTSWLIGYWIAHRSPLESLKNKQQTSALAILKNKGSPALLFSWLPIIGDPLCLAAGWLGISFHKSLLFIFAGKGIRYAVLLAFV